MTDRYVLDTEAVVALLYDEPGSEHVATIVEEVAAGASEGFLASLNASEVFYLVARFEGTDEECPTPDSLRIADRDVRALQRAGLTVTPADWRTAGEVKAHGQISLADAAAVALADQHDATLLVGGDDDFADLPIDVSIERFRDEGT